MELEVRHLRVLVAVADHGSATKAAAALGLSQPSLSGQVRRIDDGVQHVGGCRVARVGGQAGEHDDPGVRGAGLQVMQQDYVTVTRTYGGGNGWIFIRHLLPNVSSVLIVQATVAFAVAILAEAALSYLGLGTPPPTPSWGRMLSESQTFLDQAPLLAFWPGVSIALTVLGFNLLGDGLRDLLDPKLVERLPAQG